MLQVAITGLGLVCGLGADVRTAWPRLMGGAHAIAPIARFDASSYSSTVAAEVPTAWMDGDAHAGDARLRHSTRLFLKSAREAWEDAGLDRAAYAPARIGVTAGATVNYLNLGRLRDAWRCRDGAGTRLDLRMYCRTVTHPEHEIARRDGDSVAALTARALGASGIRAVIDTACSASSHAIVDAARAIARGRASAMIAGGGCGIVMPLGLLAFSRIGALSTSRDPDAASRPFDRKRDGFVMGEAGATVVLERLEDAHRRGAPVYALVAGAGQTTTAASLTDPSPDGGPEARAMSAALEEAGLDPAEVDYVAAHGTSTPKNDLVESRAIEGVLGARAGRLAVSSLKGALGHSLAAAGACNVVAAALAIARGEIPPTAGLREPDPECRLDYVPREGRRARVGAALANAFAFGGHNVSIALVSADRHHPAT